MLSTQRSHNAITNSLLPKIKHVPNETQFEIIKQDFSQGPWWPSRTVMGLFYVYAILFYATISLALLILSSLFQDQDVGLVH
jgi:hypothetical protein